MSIIIDLLVSSLLATVLFAIQAYLLGQQSKPIHQGNYSSSFFQQLAQSFTHEETDYLVKVPVYSLDLYTVQQNK